VYFAISLPLPTWAWSPQTLSSTQKITKEKYKQKSVNKDKRFRRYTHLYTRTHTLGHLEKKVTTAILHKCHSCFRPPTTSAFMESIWINYTKSCENRNCFAPDVWHKALRRSRNPCSFICLLSEHGMGVPTPHYPLSRSPSFNPQSQLNLQWN